MASVREVSPGHWEVRVSAGTSEGKRRRISRTVRGTRADADALALKMELGLGLEPTVDVTLDGYFRQVFMPSRCDLSPTTLENYSHLWKRVSEEFGSMPLSEPPHQTIQSWALSMPRGASVHCVKLLRCVLRDAWYSGLLDREPMQQPIRFPRAESEAVEVWSADEALEALERLKGHQIYPLVLLMVGAGLRRSEALAASWEDVSWDCRSIRVDKAMHRGTVGRTKNRFSVRSVPIAEPFASMLWEIKGTGRICPMTEDAARSAWRRLRRGLLSDFPIQMKNLRHTHESLMRDAGVPDSVNSQLHGHSDIKTDYRHYLARTSASSRDAAERLGRYMEEAGGIGKKKAARDDADGLGEFWSGGLDSNQRPLDPQSSREHVGAGRVDPRSLGWRVL